jgi:hypothetical protein
MANIEMAWARGPDGNLKSIKDAQRGASCGCTCLDCQAPLVARKGDILQHHYAHLGGSSSCSYSPMTALHRRAQELIQKNPGAFGLTPVAFRLEAVYPGSRYRSDIGCHHTHVYVEVVVQHDLADAKSAYLRDQNFWVYRVDLHIHAARGETVTDDHLMDLLQRHLELYIEPAHIRLARELDDEMQEAEEQRLHEENRRREAEAQARAEEALRIEAEAKARAAEAVEAAVHAHIDAERQARVDARRDAIRAHCVEREAERLAEWEANRPSLKQASDLREEAARLEQETVGQWAALHANGALPVLNVLNAPGNYINDKQAHTNVRHFFREFPQPYWDRFLTGPLALILPGAVRQANIQDAVFDLSAGPPQSLMMMVELLEHDNPRAARIRAQNAWKAFRPHAPDWDEGWPRPVSVMPTHAKYQDALQGAVWASARRLWGSTYDPMIGEDPALAALMMCDDMLSVTPPVKHLGLITRLWLGLMAEDPATAYDEVLSIALRRTPKEKYSGPAVRFNEIHWA